MNLPSKFRVDVQPSSVLPSVDRAMAEHDRARAAGGDDLDLVDLDLRALGDALEISGLLAPRTLGAIPPAPNASKFGPNAAWKKGVFGGQLTLVSIVDARLEIEHIALDTLDAYLDLAAAAAKDNVLVAINSGFRFVLNVCFFTTAAALAGSNSQCQGSLLTVRMKPRAGAFFVSQS
jgi:hypothetical protein